GHQVPRAHHRDVGPAQLLHGGSAGDDRAHLGGALLGQQAGTALSRVAASGPPRHRAPASAFTAATPPWPAKRLTSALMRAAPSRPQLSFWARPSLARSEKLWRKKPLTREVGRFKSRQGSGSPRPWASRAVSSASARGTDAVWSLPALA